MGFKIGTNGIVTFFSIKIKIFLSWHHLPFDSSVIGDVQGGG